MKNIMEIKQNINMIAQDDILIKLNWHKTTFLGKFTLKTVNVVYFLVIWKVKTDLSFT